MILGRLVHPPSACFDEINAAVGQMTDRSVVFNAHAYPAGIPEGAIVYNLENFSKLSPAALRAFGTRECWDFSERNASMYHAKHAPIGYHRSFERFGRRQPDERDIDVVFTGSLNPRRARVLDQLRDRGLHVVAVPSGSLYGARRDEVLSRSRLALNMLFYEDGTFPALRVAHLVANSVPVLSERCPESWEFVPTVTYDGLVDRATAMLEGADLEAVAAASYEAFRAMPMSLP